MEVLSCVEPNWTKFDILARLCQSVLVHQESVEGDTYRQPGADAVIDGGATVGSNHHGVGSSVEQQVDLIVQGLMAKVFDIAESGSSSRKRGLSISGDEQMPFPKHIAV